MSTENHTNFLGIPSQRSKYHKLKRLLIKSCTENEIQMYSIKIIAQCTLDVLILLHRKCTMSCTSSYYLFLHKKVIINDK